ncbi:ABC transporter substrate-binding protein [Acidisphaera rubrifaciens]|uniref:ABC transporter toluene transporter auxiliary component Ttg1D/Ttg2D n=1 Tax=Acidisphaera rubrifaciens HS-AP3 TaxID=1231350 RepID=A0A0D6P7U0_9PROT|nr:ABC transporter substrate-binding protein [Acidisphaera rubrifaciens]GAN77835.1 ABC transporter toluene transporter auxiliary component Ttg1D/Ttg2D [Acidisphaera rubrifaciens HS-AP3]
MAAHTIALGTETGGFARRRLLGFAAAGVAAALLARPGLAHAASYAEGDGAAAPVKALGDALIQAMRAGAGTPFAQRYAMIAPAIDRAFDLQTILRVSVGPRWASMTPDEQAKLLDVFRRYTVASYVANFDSYSGQTLDVTPSSRALPGGEQVVDTTIGDAKLSYVMRQVGGQWKAVDVLADGSISRVAVQRSDFRSVINSGGSQALMASLQRKVSDLSGGSLA